MVPTRSITAKSVGELDASLPEEAIPPLWHPLVGQTVAGTYRVTGVIDRGGMGVVLDAEHIRLERPVAIKVLDGHQARDANHVARFEREVEILSAVRHPHVVAILDRGVLTDGTPFLVMERLEGCTLAQRIYDDEHIPLEDAVVIVRDVAAALTAIHDATVIHRDLKPENVFLVDVPDAPGFVKLLDFGIGTRLAGVRRRITDAQQIVGTPLYMSPEQALGQNDEVDARSDQFALGVVTFEMLAGVPPFRWESILHLINQIVDEPAPLVSSFAGRWARPLDPVLARAMAKTRRERYPNVRAFSHAFAAAAKQVSIEAPMDRALSRRLEESLRAQRRGDNEGATRALLDALDLADAQPGQGPVFVPAGDERFERILLERLGGEDRVVAVPGLSGCLTRAQSYLSNIARDRTVGAALQRSALGRLQSLRTLVTMAERGIVRLSDQLPMR